MNYLQKLHEASKLVHQLALESPISFDERFRITSVPFCIPDFNSLGYELNNFTFQVSY